MKGDEIKIIIEDINKKKNSYNNIDKLINKTRIKLKRRISVLLK